MSQKYNPAHVASYAISVMRDFRNFKIMRMSIPTDAATARTPESEEDPTPKLYIPTSARVAHLIKDARMWEDAAESKNDGVTPEVRAIRLQRAARLRVKAICIHLGIDEE